MKKIFLKKLRDKNQVHGLEKDVYVSSAYLKMKHDNFRIVRSWLMSAFKVSTEP